MLGGLDPILIFNFYKLTPQAAAAVKQIPVISEVTNYIGRLALPPIPLYLSEKATGLTVASGDKSIEIETTVQGTYNGLQPPTFQRPINSITSVTFEAVRGSLGLILLSALAEQIVPLVTSREYSITYINDEVTIIGGLLHSFNISTNKDTTLAVVKMEISKVTGEVKPAAVNVNRMADAQGLAGGSPVNQAPTIQLTSGPSGPPPTAPSAPAPVNMRGLN